MIYLYDNNTAKRLHEERVRRSLAKASRTHQPIDVFVLPAPSSEADIVEVEFGTWCETQQLGA